jgi:hypothetical protein
MTNPTDPNAAIPHDGKLDPHKLDVAAKPKVRWRARNRPEPDRELRDGMANAEARAFARPIPPGIMLEPAGFDEEHWTSPHSDVDLWQLQLADAFGTRSRAVVITFMGQLQALVSESHWDDEAKQWRLDENELSAVLAMVNTVKPRDEMEAALAAQMVAVHLLTMKLAARALKYGSEADDCAEGRSKGNKSKNASNAICWPGAPRAQDSGRPALARRGRSAETIAAGLILKGFRGWSEKWIVRVLVMLRPEGI